MKDKVEWELLQRKGMPAPFVPSPDLVYAKDTIEHGFDRPLYQAFGWVGCCASSCPACAGDAGPSQAATGHAHQRNAQQGVSTCTTSAHTARTEI